MIINKRLSFNVKYDQLLPITTTKQKTNLPFSCQKKVIIFLILFTLCSMLTLYNVNHPTFTTEVNCLNLLGDFSSLCLSREFWTLLQDNPSLILLNPDYLIKMNFQKKCQKGVLVEDIKSEWKDFQWRFNLPSYASSNDLLTVGLVSSVLNISTLNLGNFTILEEIVHPETQQMPLHYFLYQKFSLPSKADLYLHILVLYSVQEYLWIGKVPEKLQTRLNNLGLQFYYGLHEQIFDPIYPEHLTIKTVDKQPSQNITVPKDILDFISQLPTSRYLHCPLERRTSWFKDANLTANKEKEALSLAAIKDLKTVARLLKMQVWLACGTLLGWYRQCTVTPYTSDTDFATWSKYLLPQANMSNSFINASAKLGTTLHLYMRFGEPTATQEFSFKYESEKVDLFFIYPNGSFNFLLPFHGAGEWAYSIYPTYSLCSVVFLGLKVNAPCDPKTVILAEYGPNWTKPLSTYSYLSSPLNTGPFKKYNFSGQQHQVFI